MFNKMIINYKGVITFNQKEVSKIYKDMSLLIIIKIVLHEAQQVKNFLCPRVLVLVVVKILIKRLERGVLKKYDSPYRNLQFLVAKKTARTYRLINAAMKMNLVTLRDTNLLLSIDKFSKEFTRYAYASLINFFLGYN